MHAERTAAEKRGSFRVTAALLSHNDCLSIKNALPTDVCGSIGCSFFLSCGPGAIRVKRSRSDSRSSARRAGAQPASSACVSAVRPRFSSAEYGQRKRRPSLTGIGGFFFRSKDPKALAAWYERHLGVTQTPKSYQEEPWKQEAGMTIFAPFPEGNPIQFWEAKRP
jgi:hypothetical protein